MELPKSEVPERLSLDQLCTGALRELERLGYSRRMLRRYRTVWERLSAFASELNLQGQYSTDLAIRFEQAYGLSDGEQTNREEGWRRHLVFCVRVLDDYARMGRIDRFLTDMKKLQIPPAMVKPLRAFERYERERRHLSASTLQHRMLVVAAFLAFLGTRNVVIFDQIRPDDIEAFVTSRQHMTKKSIARIVSELRSFFRFLFIRDVLPRDLSAVLPRIRVVREATIPSVWEPVLVAKLLAAVDRSSPKGKRDFAILLLASRLGLRVGDIRSLTLEGLDWDAATIHFAQRKTGAPQCLPLDEEVGQALIDYLKFGRPHVEHREVFLTLTPPYEPFSDHDSLDRVVNNWRRLASIEFRSRQRHGLHSLRHTLATRLLRAETPFHVISDVLGHASVASTLIYAKADVEMLRCAALNTEEMRHVE